MFKFITFLILHIKSNYIIIEETLFLIVFKEDGIILLISKIMIAYIYAKVDKSFGSQ